MQTDLTDILKGLTTHFAGQVSGQSILRHVRAIRRSDIWNSFDRYQETAQYLAAELKRAGAGEVEILNFPTGRDFGPGRWTIDQAWIPHEATLTILHPPVEKPLVACYTHDPYTLVGFSTPTPEGGVEADLVILEEGDDQDLRGKIVLTTQGARGVRKRVVEKGGLGIVSHRGSEFFPDAVVWERFGWGGWKRDDNARCFGFSVSKETGERLRELLRREDKVRVRADVQTRLEPGVVPVITGVIPGAHMPDEEILVLAHPFEPGAADNASGCAVNLEVARALSAFSQAGKPFPLRRSIRFLFIYECFGVMDYLRAVGKPFTHWVAALNVDCVAVGEPGAQPALLNHRNPDAAAGFTDTLMALLMSDCLPLLSSEMRGEESEFGLADNLVGDPAVGVPTATLMPCAAYPSYHNSRDTPEVLSEERLQAVAAIAGAYLAFLSTAGLAEAESLGERVAKAARERIRALPPEDDSGKVHYVLESESRQLRSLMRLVSSRQDRLALDRFLKQKERLVQEVAEETAVGRPARQPMPDADGADLPIPVRTGFELPMSVWAEKFPDADALALIEMGATYLPLLWADGRRNLADIASMLGYEGHPMDLPRLQTYFQILAKNGFVSLHNPQDAFTQADLESDIRALGIQEGDTVFLHSSLSSIGFVLGGADTVVEAFSAVLGEEGTLAAPVFERRYPFHPDRTPASTGAIPEALRRRIEAFRSRQPTHSVAAIGKNAECLVVDHENTTPCGREGPYGKLVDLDAKIISIACGVRAMTFFHALEDWADLPYLADRDVSVVTESGRVETVHVEKVPPGHRDFYLPNPKVERLLRDRQAIREGKVGKACAYIMSARELASLLLPALAEDPTLFLCDDPGCDFCSSARKKCANRRRTNC